MAPRRGVSDVTPLPLERERKRVSYSIQEGDLNLEREESNPSLEGCETPFSHRAMWPAKLYITTKGTLAPFSSVSTARYLTGHDLWRLNFYPFQLRVMGLFLGVYVRFLVLFFLPTSQQTAPAKRGCREKAIGAKEATSQCDNQICCNG